MGAFLRLAYFVGSLGLSHLCLFCRKILYYFLSTSYFAGLAYLYL